MLLSVSVTAPAVANCRLGTGKQVFLAVWGREPERRQRQGWFLVVSTASPSQMAPSRRGLCARGEAWCPSLFPKDSGPLAQAPAPSLI